MRFYIEDAFTEENFGGNTAGTVILCSSEEFPDDEIMIKVARELRYSETAFVKPIKPSTSGERQFHIRYFTPVAEVELCGHATIGSFGAIIAEGLALEGDTCRIHTLSGELEVTIKNGFVMMEMARPVGMTLLEKHEEREALARVLGINDEDLILTPQLVSTGLPDIIVGVASKKILLNMKPNFSEMIKLSKKYGAVGIHAFAINEIGQCTNNGNEDAVDISPLAFCRNFAPLYGIDEEAATGTANGALTYYLYERGYAKKNEYNLLEQGESMGRTSQIRTIIEGNDINDICVKVGGSYKILVSGEIYI